MIAQVLRESGVPQTAIDVIPDEQEAVAAALAMGRQGDLVLIFADALTRSWKQVIKFTGTPANARTPGNAATPGNADADSGASTRAGANGSAAAAPAHPVASPAGDSVGLGREDAALDMTGYVRDERGLRFAGEAAD
jgi:cyanophycin synthetase